MATNLWTDVEALDRLARSARAAEERGGNGAGPTAERPWPGEAPALLPESRGAGFELATFERPAASVSGDLLDAFAIGPFEIAFVVGDVSGKGIPAGVLGAFTRSILRHVAPLGEAPGETLERVNRILCGARLDAMYITLFFGVLDVRTGRLRFANGGHPSALRLGQRGKAAGFGAATGPILGQLDRRRFDTGTLRLEPGDLVVVHTDGVTEARRRDGAFFGRSRLARALERLATRSPDGARNEVAASLLAFEGDRRHDDATLLALAFDPA